MSAMTEAHLITCVACGQRFDPAQNPSCPTCPLHSGCVTACCPNCGTSNIDPAASKWAGWVKRFIGARNHEPARTE